jgi:hypothetical protein
MPDKVPRFTRQIKPVDQRPLDEIRPKGPRPAEPERKLLDFVEALLVDVAKHNPSVKEQQIADWLVSVYVGKVPRGRK